MFALDNLATFAHALRHAGVPIDISRVGLAAQAVLKVGLGKSDYVQFALEAVLLSRPEDRAVFEAIFNTFFRASQQIGLLKVMDDGASVNVPENKPSAAQSRAQEVLTSPMLHSLVNETEGRPDNDSLSLQASANSRLRQTDFRSLSGRDVGHMQRLLREVPLDLPKIPGRRLASRGKGSRLDWTKAMKWAAHHDGELAHLPYLQGQKKPLPLLILIDISGSMAIYARWISAFLHKSTRKVTRSVFAFGTELTDLNAAFRLNDTDAMLNSVNHLVKDFGSGTRLGDALQRVLGQHGRNLVGRRTVVLLISDGLDTCEPEVLEAAMQHLKRRSRHILWLNPLLRFEGYSPTARGPRVLTRYVDGMLPVHNLNSLEDLTHAVARLIKH